MSLFDQISQQHYADPPAEWQTKKIKFLADIQTSNVDKLTVDDEEPVRLCNYTDVYYNDRITPDLPFMEATATVKEIEKFTLKAGQVFITKDSEGWDDIGIPALVTEDMPGVLCGYHLAIFTPDREKLDGAFLAWLCRADALNDQFKLSANGVTRFGLGQYPMKNAVVAYPPLETQKRIAAFLTKKTKQIDGLIAKKQSLLEGLAERRQAIITQAVTKGLDPAVPMKDSGIASLGQIPAHWEVKRLRFLLNGNTLNGLYKPKEQFADDGVPFVQMGEAFRDLQFSGGTKDRVITTSVELEKWGLRTGDFLIARRSLVFSGSGKSVLIGRIDQPHLFESSMIRLRPVSPSFSSFLSYYFQSSVCRSFVLAITKQVTISGIDSQQLKNVVIFNPPEEEAGQIATFLLSANKRLDQVTATVEASIGALREYRASLITAAVTGKMEI